MFTKNRLSAVFWYTAHMKNNEQGQVGVLIGVAVTVLTIGYLFVTWMSAPTNQADVERGLQPLTASGTVPTNQIQRYEADIDAAGSVQDTVNASMDNLTQSLQEL